MGTGERGSGSGPATRGRFEVDHVFVAVSRGAPEADRLVAAGFAEGSPNTHPGQGTACRRIFFVNGYLELIWLADGGEASSPPVQATSLAQRAGGEEGASRIGVCLRAREGVADALPVATWPYGPAYLPEGVSIPMAANSSVPSEPLLFFLPAVAGPPRGPGTSHPNGARAITRVRITLRGHREPSPELAWLEGSGSVEIHRGECELLAVELDQGARGGHLHVPSPTPLHLSW